MCSRRRPHSEEQGGLSEDGGVKLEVLLGELLQLKARLRAGDESLLFLNGARDIRVRVARRSHLPRTNATPS